MGLRHAVITSVDRDDLPDGGARHWAAVIRAIHERSPSCAVEVLTPDFRGVPDALDIVLAAAPEVFSHNIETVPRLYRQARPGSRYDRTLALLAEASRRRDEGSFRGRVKTGIMLGLGETARRGPRDARRHPRHRRRGPDHRPVPAADAEAPAGRPLRPPGRVRAPTRPTPWSWASCTARPARWCARRTTPTSTSRPNCAPQPPPAEQRRPARFGAVFRAGAGRVEGACRLC